MAAASIDVYHDAQTEPDREICNRLRQIIDHALPNAERKIWHAHPVWFLDGNPIVGYSKLKHCVRLLFWSGQSFANPGLAPEGTFKAAEIRYTSPTDVEVGPLQAWLEEAKTIQWDYKNIVKKRGQLDRLL